MTFNKGITSREAVRVLIHLKEVIIQWTILGIKKVIHVHLTIILKGVALSIPPEFS